MNTTGQTMKEEFLQVKLAGGQKDRMTDGWMN